MVSKLVELKLSNRKGIFRMLPDQTSCVISKHTFFHRKSTACLLYMTILLLLRSRQCQKHYLCTIEAISTPDNAEWVAKLMVWYCDCHSSFLPISVAEPLVKFDRQGYLLRARSQAIASWEWSWRDLTPGQEMQGADLLAGQDDVMPVVLASKWLFSDPFLRILWFYLPGLTWYQSFWHNRRERHPISRVSISHFLLPKFLLNQISGSESRVMPGPWSKTRRQPLSWSARCGCLHATALHDIRWMNILSVWNLLASSPLSRSFQEMKFPGLRFTE